MSNKNIILINPNTPIAKIQSALKKSGYTIKFTKGTYDITRTLLIYSNTNIILDDAELVRKNPKQIFMNYLNPKVSYNYNATENVSIAGKGKLIGNGSSKTCSTISLMHCNNFVIDGIEFTKTVKSHSIDISGSNNVFINNVKFSKRIINLSKSHKEEVNIDWSFYGGFPYYPKGSKCFNGNTCKNVRFNMCNFRNTNVCIGSHTESDSLTKHENIKVEKCIAVGLGEVKGFGSFIKLINTDGLYVLNNKISGFNRGIELTSCNKFYTLDGIKSYNVPNGKTGCKNVHINNNTISNAKGTVKAAGILVTSEWDEVLHSDIEIRNNKFNLNNVNAKYDIYIAYTNKVDISGNETKLDVIANKDNTDKVKIS